MLKKRFGVSLLALVAAVAMLLVVYTGRPARRDQGDRRVSASQPAPTDWSPVPSKDVRFPSNPDVEGFSDEQSSKILDALAVCLTVYGACGDAGEEENVALLLKTPIRPLTAKHSEGKINAIEGGAGSVDFDTGELLFSASIPDCMNLVMTCMHEIEHLRLAEDPRKGDRNQQRMELFTQYETRASLAEVARAKRLCDWLAEHRANVPEFDEWYETLTINMFEHTAHHLMYGLRNDFLYVSAHADRREKALEAQDSRSVKDEQELQAVKAVGHSAWIRGSASDPQVIVKDFNKLDILMGQLLQLGAQFGNQDVAAHQERRAQAQERIRRFDRMMRHPARRGRADLPTPEEILEL